MQQVRIQLTASGREAEVHPIWDLIANGDAVERATALQWTYTGDALGMLHYCEGDADAFEAALADVDRVIDADLVRTGDDEFYAYVRGRTTTAMSAMWEPVSAGGMIVVPPIRYHADGTASVTLFGPEAEHRRAFESVPEPVDVTVEAVGDLGSMVGAESRLSDRQREAVAVGLELGYYETPREASQRDVADALECAPSTAAEHLQKAEATLVKSALGE